MRHRIFIAINLPESIRKNLANQQLRWADLPCRWTREKNLHITLAFLGYLSDEEVLEVCKIAKEAAKKHEPFFIKLNKIIYGPPAGTPRMVWAEGERSEELGELQKDLENSLGGLSAELKSEQGRGYSPHITLGRLKQWEFRAIDPEERPEVNEDINFNFEVNSIDVMESDLKKGGPEYCVLESISLGQN